MAPLRSLDLPADEFELDLSVGNEFEHGRCFILLCRARRGVS